MMGFAIAPSPRVLNKLALQTCHKAASGCKGLFGLVANRVGRAGAWWPRAADVPGAGRKGSGSLEPKELGISGGRLSQARTVLAHSSGLARAMLAGSKVVGQDAGQQRCSRLGLMQVQPFDEALAAINANSNRLALLVLPDKPGLGDRVHDHLAQIAAKLVAAALLPATILGVTSGSPALALLGATARAPEATQGAAMTNEPAVLSNTDPVAVGDESAALETGARSKLADAKGAHLGISPTCFRRYRSRTTWRWRRRGSVR